MTGACWFSPHGKACRETKDDRWTAAPAPVAGAGSRRRLNILTCTVQDSSCSTSVLVDLLEFIIQHDSIESLVLHLRDLFCNFLLDVYYFCTFSSNDTHVLNMKSTSLWKCRSAKRLYWFIVLIVIPLLLVSFNKCCELCRPLVVHFYEGYPSNSHWFFFRLLIGMALFVLSYRSGIWSWLPSRMSSHTTRRYSRWATYKVAPNLVYSWTQIAKSSFTRRRTIEPAQISRLQDTCLEDRSKMSVLTPWLCATAKVGVSARMLGKDIELVLKHPRCVQTSLDPTWWVAIPYVLYWVALLEQ